VWDLATIKAQALLGTEGNDVLIGYDASNDAIAGLGGNDTLYGYGSNDSLVGGSGADSLYGGTGDDLRKGGEGNDYIAADGGADTIVLDSLIGSDTIDYFTTGADKISLSQSSLPVGDGDTLLEGAVSQATSGGFATSAELVIITANASSLSAAAAASIIGSAASSYAVGDERLFVVDNGYSSGVFYFQSADANATVSASELTLLATLNGTASTSVGDYVFGS
jgi:hypothetical protein